MRILKIIHGYPPEYNAGSEVYSQSLCNELANDHEVFVLSREENDYALDFRIKETISSNGIRHFRVNMARGKDGYNHPYLNTLIKEQIEKINPEIAHIGHLNHLSTGIVDELHSLGVPILFTLHDFWLMCPRGQFLQRNFDGQSLFSLCHHQNDSQCADSCYSMYYSGNDTANDKNYWTNWIATRMKTTKSLIEKIDKFHAPSRYLRDRFINEFKIPAQKIFYLDYGFPTHYLQPAQPVYRDEYTFGYIGTHTPGKGINILIEAFSKLSGNTRLKIFGRTNGQNTIALKNLSKSTRIEFCGEYDNENLSSQIFNQVDCIVVPSIWGENSPLVIHEAQACRIPVITADHGGMAEFVQHMVNGLLFKHRDIRSLEEQMQFAILNKNKMQKLGERGYLYSENGNVLSIKEHANQIFEMYCRITQYAKSNLAHYA